MLVMKCGDVMGYLALYRKYRPNDLTSVVGQEEIKKILATSVKRGTITHAYLFSGLEVLVKLQWLKFWLKWLIVSIRLMEILAIIVIVV